MSALPPLGGPDAQAAQTLGARRRLLVYLAVLAVIAGGGFAYKSIMKDDTDALKAGDSFRNNGSKDKPETERVSCADSGADYKVIKVVDGVTSLMCSDVEGTTGALTQHGATSVDDSFVVCFRDNS